MSPCLSRKLFAVVAAPLASEKETDEGSWWNLFAVAAAACFCCHVVPSLWVLVEEEDGLDMFAKRDCSSFSCEG